MREPRVLEFSDHRHLHLAGARASLLLSSIPFRNDKSRRGALGMVRARGGLDLPVQMRTGLEE